MPDIELNSLKDLKSAARKFIASTAGKRIFAFYGPMGSGKTTLIKAICEELGAKGVVTSPTFSLVNEYVLDNGEIIYHFDLYRINSIEELYDLGYEEYFFGDQFVFIEWADRAESLLPEQITRVTINQSANDKRLISIAF